MRTNEMRTAKLSEIFDMQMGKTPDRNNPEYWENGTHPWISIADMTSNGKNIIHTKECITQKAVDVTGIKPIYPGTTIMSFKLSVGKVARVTTKCYSNEAIMAFEIPSVPVGEPMLTNAYAYYLLKSLNFDNVGNKAVMGKTLNKAILSDTIVKYHTHLDKQYEIVKMLDKVCDLIDNRKQQLQLLDDLVKARFVEMFGDLVIGDKVDSNKNKIGDIASVTKLAGFEFTKYIQYKEQGDIIMLRGLNCKKGRLVLDDIKWIDKETSDLLPRSKLYYGDILMTYAGTIGDVAMVDSDDKYHLAPNVAKITLNDKTACNPVFLMYLFMYTNDYIMTFASVVAQASINMEKIRNFEYYFPPVELQNEFATFVEQVDKSKVAVQKALDGAQTLFDSLMQEYFG